MNYRIIPPDGFLEARLSLPLSKSMSNRALIINALTPGAGELEHVAACDDTDAMRRALSSPEAKEINVGAAGTTMRFLTAYFAACEGREVTLDGSERMRQRPIGVLVDALRALGADIEYAGEQGFPPLHIRGRKLKGGELSLDSTVSSQFISALLMVAPTMSGGLKLSLKGETVSRPYILMTLRMMEDAGIESDFTADTVTVAPQTYRPFATEVEGDWSAAAMLLVAGAVAGEVTVRNVRMLSQQADTAVCNALVRAGAAVINDADSVTACARDLRAFEFDATNCPDLFPALAALAASAEGVSVIRGTSRLEYKECNRAEAIREEYGRLGIEVDTSEPDTMRIRGGRIRGGTVSSHGDHRMAMSLAVAALRSEAPITIEGSECVAKSYPGFFEDLQQIRR